MYHQHFNTLDSTQVFLKNNLEKLKSEQNDILISASHQTHGIGRSGNNWDNFENSLAMSFTIAPNKIATLTPLEIGVLTVKFFHRHFNKELYIKWPNDLMTKDGKKCGGILCQYIDSKTVIVGIGINLGKHERITNHQYRYDVGSVDQQLEINPLEQEKICRELYEFYLEERITNYQVLKADFNRACIHLNREVFIFENEKDFVGEFTGIGENGEALISINGETKAFLNSSLTILS